MADVLIKAQCPHCGNWLAVAQSIKGGPLQLPVPDKPKVKSR